MVPNSTPGILGQFRTEIILILVLVNIILVFTLMSDIQSLVAFGGPIQHTSKLKPATTTASAEPAKVSAAPVVQAATLHQPPAPTSGASTWPIRGRVTTEFGQRTVYQSFHTGTDISSGKPAGSVAVTPFRAGTVSQIIHSSHGLGNHVVVDHGGGITSYYCHLNSITAQQGQTVKPGDTLGYEGRTGAATGTHLHLDIRQNGQSVNPRGFIAGNPY